MLDGWEVYSRGTIFFRCVAGLGTHISMQRENLTMVAGLLGVRRRMNARFPLLFRVNKNDDKYLERFDESWVARGVCASVVGIKSQGNVKLHVNKIIVHWAQSQFVSKIRVMLFYKHGLCVHVNVTYLLIYPTIGCVGADGHCHCSYNDS